jgi:apolipoprotein N-acyltransferase
MQNTARRFLLSTLSALLLSVSWYYHLSIVSFFALVPLLLLEHELSQQTQLKKLTVFVFSYWSFLIWNILVTWWVVYASFGGACIAFVFNSLFMALVFVFYSTSKKLISKNWAIWLLIPIWVAWEHWHTVWDLSWTWLTLGNVFAFNHHWIQWYEFTGTSGGTVWILATNILVFKVILKGKDLKLFSMAIFKIAASIISPIILSWLIVFVRTNTSSNNKTVRTLVVQPNIDPYNTKFTLDYQSQFFKMLQLIRTKVDSNTDYLVLPETFVTDNINEAMLPQAEAIQWFQDSLIRKFPKLKIVTGLNTYVFYQDSSVHPATSRLDEESGKYYDFFNTAMQLDKNGIQIYHKSKLVPGVERMPFPALLKPLESLAIDMGGTMGSLGTQDKRMVFKGEISVAPVVCYESVYANYVTEYIRLGAEFIFIITNDGWWENTPGYVQHLNYARLRAIENRREIARSANTGISCFIDRFGNTSHETDWWKEAVIEKNMTPNTDLTFFSRFGDVISYFSLLFALGLVGWRVYLKLTNR